MDVGSAFLIHVYNSNVHFPVLRPAFQHHPDSSTGYQCKVRIDPEKSSWVGVMLVAGVIPCVEDMIERQEAACPTESGCRHFVGIHTPRGPPNWIPLFYFVCSCV